MVLEAFECDAKNVEVMTPFIYRSKIIRISQVESQFLKMCTNVWREVPFKRPPTPESEELFGVPKAGYLRALFMCTLLAAVGTLT
jgi:hypothetical protein